MFIPPILEITTVLPCSQKCSYCPQKLLMDRYGDEERMLSMENFNIVMDNLVPNMQLVFGAFSEPFGNPNCVDMLIEANNRNHPIHLFSTLIGANEEDLDRIKDIPFVGVAIHDIGQKLPNIPFNYGVQVVENPWSRAGNLWHVEPNPQLNHCSRTPNFDINVLVPNGDLYLCCNDFGLDHKLGNLLTTKFTDIKREGKYALCQKCNFACR